jgi:flavine halogenase
VCDIVIQGEADVSVGLTEDELQKAMEFCLAVFAPTNPEVHAAVAERLADKADLLRNDAPALLPEDVVGIIGTEDEEAVHVVKRINARKITHSQVNDVRRHFVQESFEGLVPSIQRGELGLRVCTA